MVKYSQAPCPNPVAVVEMRADLGSSSKHLLAIYTQRGIMWLVTLHPGAESSLPLGVSRNAVDGQGRRLTWDVGGRQHRFESLLHIPGTCLNPWAVYRLVLVGLFYLTSQLALL